MLGRLFNSRSVEYFDKPVVSPVQARNSNLTSKLMPASLELQKSPTSTSNNFTNDDSYSRTVLYGTPNPMRCPLLESHDFRVLIVQDKGEIINRDNHKVLYDSARDHHFDKPNARLSNRHPMVELLDVAFGNPIHQDFHYDGRVKMHVLSKLKDLPDAMLISRYFTVGRKVFALAVVIPLKQKDFAQCLLPNWAPIKRHLSLIQSTFVENHVTSKKSPSKPQVNYLDVAILFKQFIGTLQNLITIPRLLLGITQYDTVFQNWSFEVNNWIEIKDGARMGTHGTKFLPTLITVVNDIKNQLVNSDFGNEQVRVVIMALNPIVVQKLIFILSGILPYNTKLEIKDPEKPSTLTSPLKQAFDVDDMGELHGDHEHHSNDGIMTFPRPTFPRAGSTSFQYSPTTPSMINKGWEIPNTPSRSIATPSIMTPSRSSVIQPLSTSNSIAQLSSSLHSHSTSFSSSLTRGFHLLQNWKNSMDSNSSGTSIQSYKSPSPSMEYDEYPWTSNSGSNTVMPQSIALPRTMSSFDMTLNMGKLKRVNPRLPHIDRDTMNVVQVGDYQGGKQQCGIEQREELLELMNRDLSTNLEFDPIKGVSILNVHADETIMVENSEHTQGCLMTLPPICGYLSDFAPSFKLQACPLSPDLESKVISTMKTDLNEFSTTRTIFVSLRAREIREFVMTKQETEVKSQVRRIYCNSKPGPLINKEAFYKVERVLEAVGDCDGSPESTQRVRELLKRL